MKWGIGLVPRANLDALPTACSLWVSNPHAGTFLYIGGPAFVPVIDDLFAEANRSRRAFPSTFFTFRTKILHAHIDRFIHGEGKICGHYRGLKPWPQEGIKNDIPDATHLSQPGPEENGWDNDLVISCVVHPGRISKPAGIVSHDACNE